MWRWVMVMLFLANALVFFWYAQQYSGAEHPVVSPLPSQNRLPLAENLPEALQELQGQ
ncbi:hypothetical protein [Nitrincola sp. A-D6]|uniref:hypothetical protein n=1 Tax=Nitrincola sp. A-D6 TaxID=1545442 RepID=UPI0013639C5C|nr:hypothetical protein [Nitrincola sp. A-D6]